MYRHHVFCCTNLRPEGHKRGSCAGRGSERLRAYMKDRAKELNLPACRINTAGCLDRCEEGPVVVIYPQGLWYRCESKEDADAILQSLQTGQVVERLLLKEKKD